MIEFVGIVVVFFVIRWFLYQLPNWLHDALRDDVYAEEKRWREETGND